MIRYVLVPIVLAGFLGILPNVAEAQYTATVLEFEGRLGTAGRRSVVAALSERIDLVERARVENSAAEQGVDLDTPEGMAQVAAAEGVSMFVRGDVRGRGRRTRITILINGPNGEELAKGRTRSPRGRRGRRLIARAVRRALRKATAKLDQTEEQEWGVGADDRAKDETEDEQPPPVRGTAEDDEEVPWEEEDDEEEESEEGPLPVFEVLVGFGGRHRDTDIALETATPPTVRRFYSATFGEIYGRITTHPLGAKGGMMAGLFASLEFAWAVGLNSVNEETQEDIGTSAYRLQGDLGWLLGPFGPVRFGPTVGFGLDSFSLDPNPILSTTEYTYVRPGAAILVDIIAPYLRVKVDAGLRLVLGTGELAPFFGESASSLGLDTGIELAGNLDFGLIYGGRFAFQSFGLEFDGTGEPAANTAVDGTDQRLIFTLFVGYRI